MHFVNSSAKIRKGKLNKEGKLLNFGLFFIILTNQKKGRFRYLRLNHKVEDDLPILVVQLEDRTKRKNSWKGKKEA